MRKKILFSLIAFLGIGLFAAQAQTDVTALYLKNAGFDLNSKYKSSDASSNLGSANGGANIHYAYGWQVVQIGDNSAASTYEFGFPGTINSPGLIPASGIDGSIGALGVSAAWSATVLYAQDIVLPVGGDYTLEYASYNSGPNVADNSRVGWIPETGSSVISTKNSFALNTWETEQLNFSVPSGGMNGRVQVGINSPNAGSGNVGRIFFDWVKIIYNGDVKDILLDKIVEATTAYGDGSGKDASVLNQAISDANIVNNDGSATDQDCADAAIALNDALYAYNFTNASEANPLDFTYMVVNPYFNVGSYGWNSTADAQNKGTATNQDVGDFAGTMPYWEHWKNAAFTGKMRQTVNFLPQGKYKVTLGVFANNGGEGTFLYAGDAETAVENADVPKFFSVTSSTLNGSLEFGLNVKSGDNNWVGIDNVSLEYLGLEPTLQVLPGSFILSENVASKTFIISALFLDDDIAISTSSNSGLTVDVNSIAKDAAGLDAGIEVTVTYDPTSVSTAVTDGTITIESGSVSKTIEVKSFKNPSATNLLGLAMGDGSYGFAPDNFGWGSTPEVTWTDGTATGYANGYRDNLTLGGESIGRVINHPVNNSPFYYPVNLEAGKVYQFTGKASNFNGAISTTFGINTEKDNSGTTLKSQALTAGTWDGGIANYSFEFMAASTGTHYLIWQTSSGHDRNFAWDLVVAEKFQVTFDSKGGSAVESIYVVNGEKAEEPESPNRGSKADFAGWYIDEAYTTEFDFETDVVTADMTLYAKWDVGTSVNQLQEK